MPKERLIGALDIGSNSLILLIARCSRQGIEPVNEVYAICRLGEQVNHSGLLSEAAMGRSLQALHEMKRIADHEGVEELLVTATSAVRDAANRSEFLVRCHEILGSFPQVLSGREEAHLTYLGATDELTPGQSALVIDVGGGSTELAFGTREIMIGAHSVNLGCVRLLEAFELNLGYSARRMQAAARHVGEAVTPLVQEICTWLDGHQPTIIASGGSATTYAAVLLQQTVYDRTQINAVTSDTRQLAATLATLSQMPLAVRKRVAGMDPDRAEVLPAGMIVLNAILGKLQLSSFRVTGNGLRTGLLRHYLETRPLP